MIAYIKGILEEKEPTRVVIEAAGIGYEVVIPISTYDKIPRKGEQVKLLIYHSVREDDEILYGFASTNEREMFAKLTGVSGVGPKMAISILSGASTGELAMAIAGGDAKRIAAIKGVGKKTAEKICVELRDKVSRFAMTSGAEAVSPIITDAIAALRALGFNEEVSSKMVAEVVAKHPEADDVEAIIKLAFKTK